MDSNDLICSQSILAYAVILLTSDIQKNEETERLKVGYNKATDN
jgi:hypothetical protein